MSLIVGIETTPLAVRAAFVRTTIRRAEIERIAEVPVSQNAEVSLIDRQRDAVATLLGDLDRRPDRVIASLQGDLAATRPLTFPPGIARRLDELLPGELDALLPIDVDNAVVDYEVISRAKTKIEVLGVAVPNDIVAEELARWDELQLPLTELAVGAMSFSTLPLVHPEAFEGKCVLLIEIGSTTTDFLAIDSGRSVFARTLSGGLDVVESGRRVELGNALKRTVAAFRSTSATSIDVAYLSGEASTVAGAVPWLADQVNVDATTLPIPLIEGSALGEPARFGRVLALAGRGMSRERYINVRRGAFSAATNALNFAKYARLLGVCLAAVALSFLVASFMRHRVARSDNTVLRDQLAAVTNEVFGSETRSASEAEALLAGGPSRNSPMPRFDAFDAIAAASQSIASEIRHDMRKVAVTISDETNEGRLELSGVVGSIAERDEVVESLMEHPCVHNIEKGTVSGLADDRKNYRITAEIACPEDFFGLPEEGDKN